MPYNQQMGINLQAPLQQSYNNAFKSYASYEIEKNIRQTIEQDMLREYDFIIQEAKILLSEINKYQGNSLTRDSNNVYFTYNGKNFTKNIDDLTVIDTELSAVIPRPVQIIRDTKTTEEQIHTKFTYLYF